jgi:hypothetical protein
MCKVQRMLLGRSALTVSVALVALQGCVLFVSHYDAGAYQNFTSLKAYHVKFLEDNKVVEGRVFDEAKVRAACDTGELKFGEAHEYAAGKKDSTRVNSITYLHNVFSRNCKLTVGGKKLFSIDYAREQADEVKINYDLAISGESIRVNAPAK